MTNCPNCFAPIEPYECKCKYCGTWYFDLAAFDFDDNKPCYIKIKSSNVCEHNATITFKAIPRLTEINNTYDTVDYYGKNGAIIKKFVSGHHCTVGMEFECVTDINDNNKNLITVTVDEKK